MDIESRTKILDANTFYLGIQTKLLMENAGRAVADEAERFKKIAIFCGAGNNGGDGFVAARHLASIDKNVIVIAVKSDKRTQIAQENFDIIYSERAPTGSKNLINSIKVLNFSDSSDIEAIRREVKDCDVLIDALLGVGAKVELREPIKSLASLINSSRAYKISVDAPTPGIEPDVTLSFHFPKAENAKVVFIGIPKEAEIYAGPGDVCYALPERRGDAHKGDFGRVLTIGGSRNFIGTPTLVAQAALRTGADLVTITCPRYVAERMPFDPNLMVTPAISEFYFCPDDTELIESINYDAVVIGNGLGTKHDTQRFLKKFLREIPEDKKIILDADALKLIEKRHLKNNFIITPHATEFEMLFSEKISDMALEERTDLVRKIAEKYESTIVLKGQIDIISNGETTKLNRTGNPGMTVGGTGDVLAGIVGALSTKSDGFSAATSGTFLAGLAGDLAEKSLGYSFTATDVIEKIPKGIIFCNEFW